MPLHLRQAKHRLTRMLNTVLRSSTVLSWLTDPVQIFSSPEVDAVFVLTSDEFHECYTTAALEAESRNLDDRRSLWLIIPVLIHGIETTWRSMAIQPVAATIRHITRRAFRHRRCLSKPPSGFCLYSSRCSPTTDYACSEIYISTDSPPQEAYSSTTAKPS